MKRQRSYFPTTLFLLCASFLSLCDLSAQPVAPFIVSQPKSLTVVQGANATFDVTATGDALGYQWRFETVDISGANGSSYTVSNAQPANVGKYSVVISNAFGSVTSANAALSVNIPPSISGQPQGSIVIVGANATFSVTASGPEPLDFQWRFNGTNISGATGSSFTLVNVQTNEAGNYSVAVTNPGGTVVSEDALLTVVTSAVLYWDIDGTNSGAGSTSGPNRPNGSWTEAFWSLSADGDAPTTTWTPGATAIFSAGTNASRNYTVSLSQDEIVGGIGFEDGTVTIAGTNALNFPGVAEINVTSNHSATISALVSGNTGLVKNGLGVLGLSATNAFTGPIQINDGVLSISQAGALGTGNAPITINGGTLGTTASGNKPFVDSERPIQIGPLDATIDIANDSAISTYDGTISGEGSTLTKTGPGDFRTRTNTFARLIVNEGTYRVRTGGKETAFGAMPTNFVRNALTINGAAVGTAVAITTPANRGIRLGQKGGTFILNQHWAINSEISGPGGLIKDAGNASFVLSLNASNSYAGKTIIKSGVVAITNDNALGAVPVSNVVDQLTLDGGRLKTTGDIAIHPNRGIFLGSGGGTIDVTNRLITGGVISGFGSLTKTGPGILRLHGTNTHLGGTFLANGILEIGDDSALGSGALDISGGTITSESVWSHSILNLLKVSGNFSIGIPNSPAASVGGTILLTYFPLPPGNVNFTGNINLGNETSKTITNHTQTVFSGSLFNTAGFVKAGAAALILSGTNGYMGATEISEGSLSISADHNLGAIPSSLISSNIVLRGGTLQANSTFVLNANRGVLLQNDGGAIYVDSTNMLTLPGPITGNGGIAKTGPGNLVLGGANNFAGPTIISDGTLTLNSSERIPNSSAVSISSGATLDLNDWTETIGSLSGSGTVRLGNGTLIVGADNSNTIFSGSITGIGNIVKVGSGTLKLVGSNNFTGGITVEGGNVAFASPLTLETIGNGSITPNLNGELLEVGQTVNITAVPEKNYFFSHWSGGVDSTNAQLQFVMQSNLVLRAHFLRVPSVFIKGSYSGLFAEDDGVRNGSAGHFSCNISQAGAFSGRVLVDGGTHGFSGKLDSNHIAQVQISRRGKTTLNLAFQADPDSEQITGTVQTSDWLASLLADRAFASSSSNVAAQAGKFTMIIPRGDNVSVSPGGDGNGTLTVGNNGILRMSGTLADNTRVSQSTSISKDGVWPLYLPLYRGKGLALCWVSFIDHPAKSFHGNFNWIKTGAALGRFYPGGFSNEVALAGSRYSTPASGSRILNFTEATVFLDDGNLEELFTSSATLNEKNVLAAASKPTNQLEFRFNLKNGSFTGGFTHSANNRRSSIRGVVLQQSNEARGFFLGTNQVGSVTIQGD